MSRYHDCLNCGTSNSAVNALHYHDLRVTINGYKLWNFHACIDCTKALKRQYRPLLVVAAPPLWEFADPETVAAQNPWRGVDIPAGTRLTAPQSWWREQERQTNLDRMEFDWPVSE